MKRQITLTLNQPSIEDALKQYVSDMGINIADASVEVQLTAGRGVNGHSADIIISQGDLSKPEAAGQAEIPEGPIKRKAEKVEEKEEPSIHDESDVEISEDASQETGTSLFGG